MRARARAAAVLTWGCLQLGLLTSCSKKTPDPDPAAASSPKQDPGKPTLDDRAAIEQWIMCGTGVATASLRACAIVSDFYKGDPLPAAAESEALLFGSCDDLTEGVKKAKRRFAVAKNTPTGFLFDIVNKELTFDQRKTLEGVTAVIDRPTRSKSLSDQTEQVRETLALVEGQPTTPLAAEARVVGDRMLVIDLAAEPDAIRTCRLTRIDHFAEPPKTR